MPVAAMMLARERERNLPDRVDAREHDPEKWEPVFGKRSCSTKS
jgi:hypothetical protein